MKNLTILELVSGIVLLLALLFAASEGQADIMMPIVFEPQFEWEC